MAEYNYTGIAETFSQLYFNDAAYSAIPEYITSEYNSAEGTLKVTTIDDLTTEQQTILAGIVTDATTNKHVIELRKERITILNEIMAAAQAAGILNEALSALSNYAAFGFA